MYIAMLAQKEDPEIAVVTLMADVTTVYAQKIPTGMKEKAVSPGKLVQPRNSSLCLGVKGKQSLIRPAFSCTDLKSIWG
jgi:hypothetical protein